MPPAVEIPPFVKRLSHLDLPGGGLRIVDIKNPRVPEGGRVLYSGAGER